MCHENDIQQLSYPIIGKKTFPHIMNVQRKQHSIIELSSNRVKKRFPTL